LNLPLAGGTLGAVSTTRVSTYVAVVVDTDVVVAVATVVVVGMFIENVWSMNRADTDALLTGNVYMYTRGDVTLHTSKSKSTVVNSTATVPLREGSTTSTRGPICTVVPSASAVARKKARS
jgi:predicted RecA/RadA family phage recombinase